MKTIRIAAALAASVALVLTGCSNGGDSEPGASTNAGTDSSENDTISLKVSVLPIAHTSPVQVAMTEGIFEKHGLDVEVSQTTTGSAVVPEVLNGSVDIAYGNLISTIQGASEGLPLVSVVTSDGAAIESDSDTNWVIVRSDSGLEEASDLRGKTVAVNALNGLVHLITQESIDVSGGDSANVDFVEIPFPEMIAALEAGRVDAISTTEPFRTIALGNEENVALLPVGSIAGTRPGLILDSYFTSEEFLQNNEEAVNRFRAAMYEAQELAGQDADAVRSAISSYLEIPEPILEAMNLPLWATSTISESDYEFMANLMVKFELLEEGNVPSYGNLIRE